MTLSKEELLMRKVQQFEAHIQKVSSFFRLAFHSGSTRRVYLSERDCKEYPLGQGFRVVKVFTKQDILEMIQYRYFDFDNELGQNLPVLVCFPITMKKETAK